LSKPAHEDNGDALVPRHGGYRKLKSFQVAQLAYDVTLRFCNRYVDRRSRTHDQMVQAARSGVQNIAEGSQASGTSKKMEMKLTNVARASLEELRLDYEDFLRHRGLTEWEWTDPRRADLIARRPRCADDVARWAKELYQRHRPHGPHGQEKPADKPDTPSAQFMSSIPSMPPTYPEIAANGALALIAAAVSLLDRQLAAQAEAFTKEGGFTERLYRVRTARRRDRT
jgi:four helix bundle suffix protein